MLLLLKPNSGKQGCKHSGAMRDGRASRPNHQPAASRGRPPNRWRRPSRTLAAEAVAGGCSASDTPRQCCTAAGAAIKADLCAQMSGLYAGNIK